MFGDLVQWQPEAAHGGFGEHDQLSSAQLCLGGSLRNQVEIGLRVRAGEDLSQRDAKD